MGNILWISRRARSVFHWSLLLAPTLFLLAVILYPFLVLVHDFPFDLSSASITGSSIISQLLRKAIYNSLLQGGASALFSFAVGFPLGVFVGRYRFRLRKIAKSLMLLPFFLPSIVVVIAFEAFFQHLSGSSTQIAFLASFTTGFPGIIAINVFFNAPLVALITSLAIEKHDPALEDSAKTLGSGKLKQFYTVWGRDGILAGTSASLLAFLYSFAGFTAPLIIGGQGNYTFEVLIYTLYGLSNVSLAAAFSVLQTLILLIPVIVLSLSWMKQGRVTGLPSEENGKPGSGKWFYAGLLFLCLFIAAEMAILASLFISSVDIKWTSQFSFAAYYQLFGKSTGYRLNIQPFMPLVNMLFYASLAAGISTLLGMAWILGKRRLRRKPDSPFDIFQYIPLLVPSVVMALSIFIVFGTRFPVQYMWLLIVIVQASVAIPVTLRIISAGFSRIPESMWESASTLNGNAFFEVELPLAGTTLGTSLMFGFAIGMGEFTATNFLTSYSSSVFMPLGIEIYKLQNLRLIAASYAAATILLMLSIMFFTLIQTVGDRFIAFR